MVLALESPTHALVDAALNTLPAVLPVLDFATIKGELFPVIANTFAKTSSLNIKIRGLEAFYTLCGGSALSEAEMTDDLNGIGVPDKRSTSTNSSSAILDKFTVQEKIVPLLKGIKTKEPGVMMAALRVFRQVGDVADSDFLAMDVLPTLWSMSLGPLLDLQQFQAFMTLIKRLSERIEREQIRKLRELRSANSMGSGTTRRVQSTNAASVDGNGLSNGEEADFETLVSGRRKQGAGNGVQGNDDLMTGWGGSATASSASTRPYTQSRLGANETPTFAWQTPPPTQQTIRPPPPLQQQQVFSSAMRSITPDQTLSAFTALTPASPFSQPLQPARNGAPTAGNTLVMPTRQQPQQSLNGSLGVGSAAGASLNWNAAASTNSFGLPPPPSSSPAKPQGVGRGQQQQARNGLDRYDSLL